MVMAAYRLGMDGDAGASLGATVMPVKAYFSH